MFPLLSTATAVGDFKLPPMVSNADWPITNVAAIPAGGAFCVFGKISARLAPVSATYRLAAWSTATPWGLISVCADTWLGAAEEFIPGCPYTRIADAPVPAPAGNSNTRLLPRSATNRSPLGPSARPAGVFKDAP